MRKTVTTVRLSERQGREALDAYIFGGRYGPRRVPRGIDPRVVSMVLAERLVAGIDREDAPKTLEIARFYETSEIAAVALKALLKPLVTPSDVILQTWLVMLAADFEDAEQRKAAAGHFETRVVPHPGALQFTPLLLEAPKVIAPVSAFDAIERSLHGERSRLAEFQNRSEADMMAHDKVAGWIHNELPKSKGVAESKGKLAGMPVATRMGTLVRAYMEPGDDYLRDWAARQLRRDAFAGEGDPTDMFRGYVTPMTEGELRERPQKAMTFWRAERAFRYFGGVIDDRILEQRMAAAPGGSDFLDDDD